MKTAAILIGMAAVLFMLGFIWPEYAAVEMGWEENAIGNAK